MANVFTTVKDLFKEIQTAIYYIYKSSSLYFPSQSHTHADTVSAH